MTCEATLTVKIGRFLFCAARNCRFSLIPEIRHGYWGSDGPLCVDFVGIMALFDWYKK